MVELIYIATSNPAKAEQFAKHLPFKHYKIVIYSGGEAKEDLPELVVWRKASAIPLTNAIVDDRGLYIMGDIPGTNIKAFTSNLKIFSTLFGGRRGRLVYAFAYKKGEMTHVYSHSIPIRISPNPSPKPSKWGMLGRFLVVPPIDKPLSEYTEKEEEWLEKRLKKEVFDPFIWAVYNSPVYKERKYSDVMRINRKIKSMSHCVIEKIKEMLRDIDVDANGLTVKKRVLLSALYYPLEAFFPYSSFPENIIFKFPCPSGSMRREGKELIEQLVERHMERIKRQKKPREIREVEERELTLSEGRIIERNGRIYVERKGREEVKFVEYKNYRLAEEVLGNLHYLSSPRKFVKVYAILDKEDYPLALVGISRVERRYKNLALSVSGIPKALEISRAYNSMWKVKGVLGFILTKLKQTFALPLLTAYQPTISKGSAFYGNGYNPFIVKPQQNFFIVDKGLPIFITRREAKKFSNVERGKMPTLPSIEMISTSPRWIHFTHKLLA